MHAPEARNRPSALAPDRLSWRGFGWWERRAEAAVAQTEDHPMAKSYPLDERRIADSVEQRKRQQPSNVKKAGKTTKATRKRQPRRKGGVGTPSRVKSASGKTKQQ